MKNSIIRRLIILLIILLLPESILLSGCDAGSVVPRITVHIVKSDIRFLDQSINDQEDAGIEESSDTEGFLEPDDASGAEEDGLPEEVETDDEIAADQEDELSKPEEAVPGAVEDVQLDPSWVYADYSEIKSGSAKLYRADGDRRDVVIGINAGHGTKGGESKKTYCHPDKTPKVTGGTTAAGSTKASAVSGGMTFNDGISEAKVALRTAQILRDKLLNEGYDVLMLRDDSDVQLDNVARTVIANNTAACLISLHWDGDNSSSDKGCFYISTPDGIKNMEPVSQHWKEHHQLGEALIAGLKEAGCKIYQNGHMSIDLTQTSYSTIPSIDIELGNQTSGHDDPTLSKQADGLVNGIKKLY